MTFALQADGLSRRFGSIVVADAMSFAVSPGECLGIIGPNGAGKTSIFNLLSGNLRPSAGRILLGGQDVTDAPAHVRARAGLARTYQVPQPFGQLTAFENVLASARFSGGLGLSAASDRAADVLDLTGLSRRADAPAGGLGLLDRKRLELARALAGGPKVLLLDEIAGGLTEAEVHVLVEMIRSIRAGLGIVWIEHVINALSAVADRILAINFGQKIAEGRPAEVMSDPAVLEVYMGAALDVAAGH